MTQQQERDVALTDLLGRFHTRASDNGIDVACECGMRVCTIREGEMLLVIASECVQHWLTFHTGVSRPHFKKRR